MLSYESNTISVERNSIVKVISFYKELIIITISVVMMSFFKITFWAIDVNP